MKKLVKFVPLAFAAVLAFGAVSCSDDDNNGTGNENTTSGTSDNVSINNVFDGDMPADVDGATFTTNSKGQVTEIKDGNTTVSFEYGSFTRANSNTYQVLMKLRDSEYSDDGSNFYIQVNAQGFAVYALQEYLDDDDNDEWWFEYNTDGQLTRLKRSESEDDFKITWTNGDITSVAHTEEDGDNGVTTIAYTNSKYTSAVANKGNLMLFDDFFNVDMDEFGVAYFAGLLGKSTKNLPMGYEEKYQEGHSSYTDTVTFNWEFNSNQYPTKFWEDDYTWDAITFSWK